mmetsp:Transcript_42035/g.47470  ORF Transcript_42035/g.47470 Transcript_42035/m.47470 type:complete len:109 (+) Transcript_42035:146-472(+)
MGSNNLNPISDASTFFAVLAATTIVVLYQRSGVLAKKAAEAQAANDSRIISNLLVQLNDDHQVEGGVYLAGLKRQQDHLKQQQNHLESLMQKNKAEINKAKLKMKTEE